MTALKTRNDFFGSQEAEDISQMLERMMANSLYNTAPSYSTNVSQYPDNLIPFVDKHMNYLNAHPKLDARMYLANLRLMTRTK